MILSDNNHHLESQRKEIINMSKRQSFEKDIAGMTITVLPHVYAGGIDSELLCSVLQVSKNDEVLDLCTGTGIVALKAAQMGAKRVIGVDLNPDAIANANINKDKLHLQNIEFAEGSLFDPVEGQKFDVITINPPYTDMKTTNKTEIAFWDEDNKVTRKFFKKFRNYLKPSGTVYFAWADFGSLELLNKLARENNVILNLLKSGSTPSGLSHYLVYKFSL